MNLVNGLAHHEFHSSVDRAPTRCIGGHSFDSSRDSEFFSRGGLPYGRDGDARRKF